MNLNQLDTEQSNPDSLHIDEMSTIDILTTINNEDQKVALAVKEVLPKISLNCKMKLELRNWDKWACTFIPIRAAAGPYSQFL